MFWQFCAVFPMYFFSNVAILPLLKWSSRATYILFCFVFCGHRCFIYYVVCFWVGIGFCLSNCRVIYLSLCFLFQIFLCYVLLVFLLCPWVNIFILLIQLYENLQLFLFIKLLKLLFSLKCLFIKFIPSKNYFSSWHI